MTLKDLKEAKIEISAKSGKLKINVKGNNRAVAVILGKVIAGMGKEETKALISDIALAALLFNDEKREKMSK